jgi:hypothetical protein
MEGWGRLAVLRVGCGAGRWHARLRGRCSSVPLRRRRVRVRVRVQVRI